MPLNKNIYELSQNVVNNFDVVVSGVVVAKNTDNAREIMAAKAGKEGPEVWLKQADVWKIGDAVAGETERCLCVTVTWS